MAKEYICLYHSYLDAIQALSDAERGRLLTAMLEYTLTGDAGPLCGNERFVFPIIKSQIDRDNAKYETKCRINAANGKNGGRPRKPKNPLGISESGKSQDKDQDQGKGQGDRTSPPSPLGGRFDRFWSAYPRKAGKGAALKAFQKLNPGEELLEQMLDTIRQQKRSIQWLADGGRFIPHPATWLNQGRWEDEPLEAVEEELYGGETL
ncbi:hypothetical protein DW094_11480 [Ruminococcaceae bacterium AM07-15]|nr:hypothetical protein DW094_11480 [Ruminococcaceae bacterium AM07-15]